MKTALFCGASSGLGKIVALFFLQKGWNVLNVDIAMNDELNAHGIKTYLCDLTDKNHAQQIFHNIFDEYPTISALINCIRFRDTQKEEHWEKEISIDLSTYYYASLLVAEYMKDRATECSIISFSSVVASLIAPCQKISYHVAKSGITQMMRYFAVYYGPYGIRANSIEPGLISKRSAEKSSNRSDASYYAKIAQHIPLRRSGSPSEVAELILFLASSQSSFITGQNICIDGGLSIREQVDCVRDAYCY